MSQVYHYVIDSRDRNIAMYPSPASYTITLPEPILNVESLKLLLADVPFSRYLIHNANNVLHVSETGSASDAVAIELIPGDYEPVNLATHLQTRLNAVCRATYTVAYDSIRDSFIIVSNLTDKDTPDVFYAGCMIACKGHAITVDDKPSTSYRSKTVCRVLGFGNADYSGNVSSNVRTYTGTGVKSGTLALVSMSITSPIVSGDVLMITCNDINGAFPVLVTATTSTTAIVTIPASYTGVVPAASGTLIVTNAINGRVIAPFRKNFVRDKYVVLRINNAENIYGISVGIDRSFDIINSKDSDLNNEYRHDAHKTFDPPLNSLKKLTVGFYDYEGNLYDFQNQEHRLELDICVWGQMRIGMTGLSQKHNNRNN